MDWIKKKTEGRLTNKDNSAVVQFQCNNSFGLGTGKTCETKEEVETLGGGWESM